MAEHREVIEFVESHGLAGRGIGWVDAHLLASARLGGIGLWALDARLAALGGTARGLKVPRRRRLPKTQRAR